MVRFGGCSPRRGFSGAQQSHNDTHSLFMFSLCVPAYCFFVKLLLYRRYRRVRTSRAEKSAPVSGVPESGVASSVRRAESSRAGRPRGGPVPGGESNGNGQCDGPRVLNAAAPGRHATTSPDRRCGKAREAGGRRRSSALGARRRGVAGAVCIVPSWETGGVSGFSPAFRF